MVYVLGGKCPGGKCPGGICPGGKCPGGTCPEGLCPRTVYNVCIASQEGYNSLHYTATSPKRAAPPDLQSPILTYI